MVFFFLLNYMSSLYILHINPLSDILFTNIFSHSIGYLFIVLAVPLTNFCFCCLCFWCHIQKIIAKMSFPMFSSFTVLGLMLQSLIHFKLIFFVSCNERVQTHSACGYSVFPTQFIEETIFSPLNILGSLVIY